MRVRKFRNFFDLTIDPFPTPAGIVNEVGKNNLLRALRLVLDPDLPDRRRRLRPDDVPATGAAKDAYPGRPGPTRLGLRSGSSDRALLEQHEQTTEALHAPLDVLVDVDAGSDLQSGTGATPARAAGRRRRSSE